jgi:hypothetical protein
MTPHAWVARVWLPYLLGGIVSVTVAPTLLGAQEGIGLVFVGLACLGIGATGALWRLRRGYGLWQALPRMAPTSCRSRQPLT